MAVGEHDSLVRTISAGKEPEEEVVVLMVAGHWRTGSYGPAGPSVLLSERLFDGVNP